MKYSMKLLEEPFYKIKNGTKTVEFRLYDEKRKQLKIGDTIEFSLLPDLKEKILTEIVDLYHANTFKDLFTMLEIKDIERKVNRMYEIYQPENEKKFGVLGIKIALIK